MMATTETSRRAIPREAMCRRCVMSRDVDPDLTLDADGICNFCRHYDALAVQGVFDERERLRELEGIVAEMKRRGRGKPYDCVVGLSGGVDSSYAVYRVHELGLRPLVVHLDNSWDSELAVMNIEQLVRGLGVDLYTHVIDWEEFRDLQLSLFRASVVDIEIVTDHAIIACVFDAARKFRIPYIVTGDNPATEVSLPRTWNHRKTDWWNIRAIHRAYGGTPIKTFPKLSTVEMIFRQRVLGYRFVPILSYLPYRKADAIATLQRKVMWRPYGGKHYESVFTRFYQGYVLPTKFGIDKRRLHFSRLICSNQMTREQALAELQTSPYDPRLLVEDREFVLKKLRLSEAEFEQLMALPPRAHLEFSSDETLLRTLSRAKRFLKRARPAH